MKNLLCSVLFALGLASSGNAAAPARPNVLFIAIDDLRDWVGYLGRNTQTLTPNIDKLAARGVRFTRSYLANKPEFAARKDELSTYLPKENHPDIGGRTGQGAEDSGGAQFKPDNRK